MSGTQSALIGGIKSIQRGTMGINTTATITAVDTSKTELRFLGGTASAYESGMYIPKVSSVVLTNSTTITSATSGGASGGSVSWELTEWY